jgi:hypothetical protein
VLCVNESHPESRIGIPEKNPERTNFLLEEGWHPLPGPYFNPPLACKEFISDAAGATEDSSSEERIGCGNIGFDSKGHIIFAHQLWWPDQMIRTCFDKGGKRMGKKT